MEKNRSIFLRLKLFSSYKADNGDIENYICSIRLHDGSIRDQGLVYDKVMDDLMCILDDFRFYDSVVYLCTLRRFQYSNRKMSISSQVNSNEKITHLTFISFIIFGVSLLQHVSGFHNVLF